jgi:DNA-binding XRE family transcriptional regulator
MRELTKKQITNKIQISVGQKYPRLFVVPKDKAQGVVQLLKEYEVRSEDEKIPSDFVFKELYEKYGKGGVVLQGLRESAGLTQAELAEKIGIRQTDVSQMEHEKRTIGKAMAIRLAKVLKTDYRVFL